MDIVIILDILNRKIIIGLMSISDWIIAISSCHQCFPLAGMVCLIRIYLYRFLVWLSKSVALDNMWLSLAFSPVYIRTVLVILTPDKRGVHSVLFSCRLTL